MSAFPGVRSRRGSVCEPRHGDYHVELLPSAAEFLADLPPKSRRIVARAIDRLRHDPQPPGSKLLSGSEAIRRVRAGHYRILYRVDDNELSVLIVRIGDRRDVYRDL